MKALLRDAHASLTRILLLLLVPSAVGLAVLTPAIVAVLFPKYVAATTLMIIFIAFTFAESLLSIPLNVLMVYERYTAVIVSRLVALLSVPAVLYAFPHYGLIGVAFAVGSGARPLASGHGDLCRRLAEDDAAARLCRTRRAWPVPALRSCCC